MKRLTRHESDFGPRRDRLLGMSKSELDHKEPEYRRHVDVNARRRRPKRKPFKRTSAAPGPALRNQLWHFLHLGNQILVPQSVTRNLNAEEFKALGLRHILAVLSGYLLIDVGIQIK